MAVREIKLSLTGAKEILPELLRDYPEKVYLGKYGGEDVWLARPSWNCGWYWGFGYVQNRYLHTHLSMMCNVETCTTNLWDGLQHHIKGARSKECTHKTSCGHSMKWYRPSTI